MMKILKKVTKLRLDVRQPDEYILKGLVSAEPDYKLSLLLNKKFKISLKNTAPISPSGSEVHSVFSRFSSSQNNSDITYTLVSNRNGKDHLLKKFRNVDFILVVHDPENTISQEELSIQLRDIESVTAVFSMDPLKIKDKNLGYLIH